MPKPTWKGSAGIVEGGVTFTFAGAARRPQRQQIKNGEAEREAAKEAAEALRAQQPSGRGRASEELAGTTANRSRGPRTPGG